MIVRANLLRPATRWDWVRMDDNVSLLVISRHPTTPSAARGSILLVHGLTYSAAPVFDMVSPSGDNQEYSALARFAKAGFSAFAVNLDGYGRSDARAGVTSPDRYARDLATVACWISAAVGASPTVLGWSCGALSVARLATMSQAPIRAAIFYGSFWGGGITGRPANSINVKRPTVLRRLNDLTHARSDFRTPGWFDTAVQNAFADQALSSDPDSPTHWLAHLADPASLFEPSAILTPFLALRGEGDISSSREDMAEILDRIRVRPSEYVEIPCSDHVAHLQNQRDAFYAAVTSFIDQVPQ